MKLKCSSHKGGILLLAMVLMVSLVVFASIYLSMVVINNRNNISQINSAKAFYLAEAGVHKAIYYLITNGAPPGGSSGATWRTTAYSAAAGNVAPAACDGTGSPTTPPCQESLGDGKYTMWVEAGTGTNIKITSQAVVNGLTRTVRIQVISTGLAILDNSFSEL